ncbi:MAG: spondin domain-containing protein [Haloarculaceae archaeon]
MSDDTTRRRFLAVAGSTTALALAGCAGGGDSGDGGGAGTDSMDDGMTETDSMDGSMTETDSMDDGMTDTDEGMMSGPTTVTVRIENVAPPEFYGSDTPTGGAIWVTPGAYAVHTAENPIFTEGEEASVGLEALAEAGPPTGFPDQPGLVDELQEMAGSMGVSAAGAYTPENTVADPNDPMGEVPGAPPIAPGGAYEFDVEAEPGQRLSFASMFVPSNDLFFAPGAEGITLWPADGEPAEGDVTDRVGLWDAGTEPNGQPGQDPDQAPAQDSPDQGADEGGVVRPLDSVMDGYDYPAVTDAIRVTLTPGGSMDG